MTKVGIIRCQEQSNNCAGWSCFPALRERSGASPPTTAIELVGFDTCGGCGRNKADKIVAKAKRLKEKGAEVIHLGSCIVGSCPTKELYVNSIRDQVQIPVVEKTHATHAPPAK